MEHSKSRKIVAIALAITMIATVTAIAHPWTEFSKTNPPEATLGPRVAISVVNGSSLDNASNYTLLSNNTTIAVQISSIVPGMFSSGMYSMANLTGLNPNNNSYYVNLLNATLNSTQSVVFLSPAFITIAREWSSVLSHVSGKSYPSLTVNAFKTVSVNNTLEIFRYYNNLKYDPGAMGTITVNQTMMKSPGIMNYFSGSGINPSGFSSLTLSNLSFSLNLTFPVVPTQIIASASPVVSPSATFESSAPYSPDCGGSGSYTVYYWTNSYNTYDQTTGINNTNGYLPMIAVHMGRGTTNGSSLIDLGGSLQINKDTINLNSAQPYVSSSGQVTTQMSTSPSYSHIGNASFVLSSNEASAYPLSSGPGINQSILHNQTTAFVSIDNVTYTFVHFNQYSSVYHNEYKKIVYYRYVSEGGSCVEVPYHYVITLVQSDYVGTTYDGSGTTGEISYINSVGNIQVSAGFLPIEVNMVVQKVLEENSAGTLPLNVSGASSSYQSSTVWSYSYGYTNAKNTLQTATKALALFSSSLGLGLAITDALAATNGADADASEPSVVAASLSLIASATGLTAKILGTFSTISFITGSNSISLSSGFHNYASAGKLGSNYDVSFYQSSYLMTMNFNGNSYQFNAPEDYVNATQIT